MELLDFRPSKMMEMMKTVMFGGLILSCCPRNPHRKAGSEKKRKEIEFWKPLENEYPFKSQNNQAVNGIFNQLVLREKIFSSYLSWIKTKQRYRFDGEAELRVSESSCFRNSLLLRLPLILASKKQSISQ